MSANLLTRFLIIGLKKQLSKSKIDNSSLNTVDVKNINLQMKKNQKIMFFHFYKNS